MSAAPTRPDDACDPAGRIARQSRALQALAEVGLELARALVDEVAAGREGRFRGVDPALAYSRIARAIRLTIALEARLDEDDEVSTEAARSAPAVGDAAESGPGSEAAERSERSECERPKCERPEGERPERERLRETSDAGLLARPNGEVYALICRDLGCAPEPGLFPDDACNDDDPEGPPRGDADQAAAPARRRPAGSGRASLLRSAAAVPLAGAPVLGPLPRPPP